MEAEAAQGKRLDALAQEISEIRTKVNTPVINNSASVDDLQQLAAKVKEIDKKRQEDRELILRKIEDLGRIAATPPPVRRHLPAPPKDENSDTPPAANAQQNGYEYKVQEGDTLSAIAKAYKEKGVKVTTSQILKANPGLSPNSLYVGKTIFIPDPNAK